MTLFFIETKQIEICRKDNDGLIICDGVPIVSMDRESLCDLIERLLDAWPGPSIPGPWPPPRTRAEHKGHDNG